MPKKILIYLMLVLLPTVCLAGEATIIEKDGQIIVEYTGDPAEAKASQEVRTKEEAKEEAVRQFEQEKQRQSSEKMAARAAAAAARHAADREAGVD